ncbi:MAG: phosphopantetheine-binding protein [bacterium]
MTDDAFLVKLSAILEVGADEVNEQFKLDYGNWDSLTVMATIAAIDEHFDLTVSPKELAACSSVKDLLELIRANTTRV